MIVAILLLFFSIGSYLFSRSIFQPAVIVNGLWGVIILLYQCLDHPLWNLSNAFYAAILCWCVPFTIISLFFGHFPVKKISKKRIGNISFYRKSMPYVIALGFLSVCGFVLYSGGDTSILRILLNDQEFPIYIKVILLFSTFIIIYFLWGLVNLEYVKKKQIVFLFLVVLIISIFKSNKTSFLSLFVSVAYIFYYKGSLNIKKIIVSVVVLISLLIVVSISRSDYDFGTSSQIEKYLFIYLLSPLPAFDLVLNNQLDLGEPAFGESVFIFFYRIFNIFGASIDFSILGDWVYVPLPTNVYTVMRIFYLEGGYYGITIGSIIMGVIWGILFRLQKTKNPIVAVFYAAMVPSLFFQTFGDYFFYTFSMTLQYLIFAIIIGRGIKNLNLPRITFKLKRSTLLNK